jgi:hypothetical protein
LIRYAIIKLQKFGILKVQLLLYLIEPVGGALLTGGIGVLAGFAGKKGKYEVFCTDCGHRWKTK